MGLSEEERPFERTRHMWEDGTSIMWFFRNWELGVWTVSTWFRIRASFMHL
jgi:hypothetical protein